MKTPVPTLVERGAPSLAHAAPADGRPFRLAGERVAVEGTTRAGVTAVRTAGSTLTGPIGLTAGLGDHLVPPTAANVIEAPRLLRRELILPGGSLAETVVVPERLPGVAIQWALATARPWRAAIEVETPATADPRLELHPHAEWHHDGDRLRAEALVPAGAALTLLLAAPGTSLPALAALEAHVRRAEADARGETGLRLVTGIPELDDGVLWARAALRGLVPPTDRQPVGFASPRPWLTVAALAAGEHDAAEARLATEPTHPLDLLAHAAWVEWTGRAGRLAARTDDLLSLLVEAPDAWRPLLRARLADALEAAGDPVRADKLRHLAGGAVSERRGGRPNPDAAPPPRPLPMATASPDRLLARALLGTPAPDDRAAALPASPESDPHTPLLHALARYTLDDPDGAFPTLRDALGAPVRRGPGTDPLVPALTLAALVHGLLGARPDAAYGRLRLAPALPAAWTRFRVEGLRIADASLTLDYRRDGGVHEWRMIPEAGALPIMLVLEPSLAGPPPATVLVDGEPAEVETVPLGDRTRIRLQLPLDAERRLTVEGS